MGEGTYQVLSEGRGVGRIVFRESFQGFPGQLGGFAPTLSDGLRVDALVGKKVFGLWGRWVGG